MVVVNSAPQLVDLSVEVPSSSSEESGELTIDINPPPAHPIYVINNIENVVPKRTPSAG